MAISRQLVERMENYLGVRFCPGSHEAFGNKVPTSSLNVGVEANL